MVKTCNMRGGGVGDIRVFPREYQSGTSAPRKCYRLQENGDVCQRSTIAGKTYPGILRKMKQFLVKVKLEQSVNGIAVLDPNLIHGNTQIW